MKNNFLKIIILITTFCLMFSMQIFAAERIELRIGTSRIAGSYQLWGSTWAKIISDNLEDITAGIEATGGPAANIQLIENGTNQIGFVSASSAYEAWNGIGWANGTKFQEQRSLFPMYPSYLHLVVLSKSKIRTIQDFVGKKVDVGSPGTTPALLMESIREVFGIDYPITNNDTAVATEAIKQGSIDVFARVTGIPTSGVMDLAISHDIIIVGFSQEEIDKYVFQYPAYSGGIIPPNTYKNQDYEVNTLAVWAFAICDKDLSEDIAYQITKVAFENQETFIQAHPDGKYLVPENVKELNIPLHPGALKYYQEIGLEIPQKLIYE